MYLRIPSKTRTPKLTRTFNVLVPSQRRYKLRTDIRGLRLVAFHPIARTDVSVHVLSVQPEHYRTLKVKLCREDTPDSPIHTSRLNTQQLGKVGSAYQCWFPGTFASVAGRRSKKYFVQLESSLSHALHKYRSVPFYFEANSSFKYVKLTFNAERKIDHSDMNQTSVVALPLSCLSQWRFFNREKIMVVAERFNRKMAKTGADFEKARYKLFLSIPERTIS